MPNKFAIRQRSTVVRADIIERKELSANVKQGDHFAIYFDECLAGIG